MRDLLRLLFRPEGAVTGRVYLCAGASLFLLKYALDFLFVRLVLGGTWMPWDYLAIQWRQIDFRDIDTVRFATLMLALALPFIWCGVILTLKRLRAVGWAGSLVFLFFIPYLNVVFLFLLVIWPSKTVGDRPARRVELMSTALVVVTALVSSFCLILLSGNLLNNYGWGLFVGVPFVIGLVPGLLYRTASDRPLKECILVALVIELCLAGTLLLFAIEGLICVLMAVPLVIPLTIFGGFIGRTILQARNWSRSRSEVCCAGTLLLMPLVILSEKALAFGPSLLSVTTTIDIDAPPQVVWNHVVSFSELPQPTEWIFRAGVAHPLRAEIQGSGPGATRLCIFSTGAFIEPIEIWNEPHLLRFSVTSNPPPMRELSFRDVHPPHLEGFLQSERGQFALTEIGPGKTRLAGTTWYRHGLWPERYWQLWSDYIIHTIHRRVLEHIKRETEHASPQF